MADNVPITAGTGTDIATDDISSVHFQQIKLVDGTLGSSTAAIVSAAGSVKVDPSQVTVRKTVTLTLGVAGAYVAKDAVGTLNELTNAARVSGGSVRVRRVQIADFSQQMADLELIFFDQTITAPTDNSQFDPTNAETLLVCGRVLVGGGFYSDFNDNSVADMPCDVPMVLAGTSVFVVVVSRGVPTYTNGDITIAVTLEQN